MKSHMPSRVAILNGPPASGKSTVAALLAQEIASSVHVSGDALRSFAPENASRVLGAGSTYRAAGTLTRFYLDSGAPLVVFDYVFETSSAVSEFRAASGEEVALFTLWGSLDCLQRRDSLRSGAARIGERLVSTYDAMRPNLAFLGEVIDVERYSAAEIAKLIRHRITPGGGS